MNPLLRVNNVSIAFKGEAGTIPAIENISFDVREREIVSIVGESGSGKSVTALSILRLLPSTAIIKGGEIRFEKNTEVLNILELNKDELLKLRGNKIGMIFQEPMTSLNPVLRCGEQVMEAIRAHNKISDSRAREICIDWLTKVKLPDPPTIFNKYPHQLSGGQKQRVMIAMAMCCNPSLLICDEPTTALDVTVQRSILDLIRQLRDEYSIGVIFITHDLGVVSELSDSIVVMYQGKIVEQGKANDVLSTPRHPYTKALLACRPGLYRKRQRLPVVKDFLEGKTPGTTLSSEPPIKKEGPILSVRNLKVSFPVKTNLLGKVTRRYTAVDDVSFDVHKGEVLGLVGESGCGKTTLGRAILRLIDADSGTISFKGRELTKVKKTDLKFFRKDVQIIFQDPYSSLNPRLSIGGAITEPLKVHGLAKNTDQRKKRALWLLGQVSLAQEHFTRFPHEFSGGQRQRIVIARALSLAPGLLVCDEAVSALDVSVQAQVLNLLNDLKKELGLTMIFISHDLSVVKYFSDRILVMREGKIVEEGDAEDIYSSPKNDYTKRLIESIPGELHHRGS